MALTLTRTGGRRQRTNQVGPLAGPGAVPVEAIQNGDAVISTDGIRLGSVQGWYDGGPLRGHLLVQGAAGPDDQGSSTVYVVPLSLLDRHDADGCTLMIAASAAETRRHWLIDVF